MLNTIIRIILYLLIALGVISAFQFDRLKRLYTVINLFDEDVIAHNFYNMEHIFDVDTSEMSDQVFIWTEGDKIDLPKDFRFKDSLFNTQEFLNSTATSGMLISKSDTIIHEMYYNGFSAQLTHISWSVSKSMISALVGIAIAEGHIGSIDDPLDMYVQGLEGGAYEGVRIKDVLQMSSGAGFDENYTKFSSDINRLGRYFALGRSLDKFVRSIKPERPPGSYHRYVSMDTQVLGILLQEATGEDITDYFQSRLWAPMGASSNAYWIEDNLGMEAVFGGLNASLRDYALFGLVYLQDGLIGSKQIVPMDWVRSSVTPDAPHLEPGEGNPFSRSHLGYGYQWWIPGGSSGEFLAIGVYNQYIYVNPEADLVIVKLSANRDYRRLKRLSHDHTIAFFRAIADQI